MSRVPHRIAALVLTMPLATAGDEPAPLPRADGYRGVWYANQPIEGEYRFKYSGGLGTYCAKHAPFAIHRPEVGRTYFCYGGTTSDRHDRLLHMVSYFDHATGTVPRPVVLLDKETGDAHDNPVIAVDDAGFVWIFSTSHGRTRPSFVHRSASPHDIGAFVRVDATWRDDEGVERPFDNFSYLQAWRAPGRGFACFYTRYADPAARTSFFLTSEDGARWRRQRLAAIEQGHYQISAVEHGTAAVAFNVHPADGGLNARTDLYYLEADVSDDVDGDPGGDLDAPSTTWRAADGRAVEVPLVGRASPARVRDYAAEGRLVYLKDLRLDPAGRPAILYLTSAGFAPGPENDPRTWTFARFDGDGWRFHEVTASDNNYDMGSLLVEPRGDGDALRWTILAPTEPGPQRGNPGGEVARWVSDDDGRTWSRARVLTAESPRNHTYVRRVIDAADEFVALWADGDGRRPSASRLYFCDREGRVFRLPATMEGETAAPERVAVGAESRDR